MRSPGGGGRGGGRPCPEPLPAPTGQWVGLPGPRRCPCQLCTGPALAGALLRLALDQLVFAPVFISAVVSSIMALEGAAADVPAKLRTDLGTMVRSNWALWVPFQFLNFRFVPPALQARPPPPGSRPACPARLPSRCACGRAAQLTPRGGHPPTLPPTRCLLACLARLAGAGCQPGGRGLEHLQ